MAAAWGTPNPRSQGQGNAPEAFRAQAQQWLREAAYRPSPMTLHPRALVFTAPFIPWVQLDDHPETALKDQMFEFNMPASLEAFIRRREPAAQRIEVCHTDSRIVVRRGWTPLNDDCVAGPGDEELALR